MLALICIQPQKSSWRSLFSSEAHFDSNLQQHQPHNGADVDTSTANAHVLQTLLPSYPTERVPPVTMSREKDLNCINTAG
jgi:hypothetical protein